MTEIPRPAPPLAGDGVAPRAFAPDDAPWVAAACTDPLTRRFLPALPDPYGEAEARAWIDSHKRGRRDGRSLVSAVVTAGDERAVGALTAMFEPSQARAELGYWLAPQARGHGHLTAAVRVLVPWLFGAPAVPGALAVRRAGGGAGDDPHRPRQRGLRRDRRALRIHPGGSTARPRA